ncbi:ATP-dependent RNA helicase p62-like [Elysia marginata]|uniref:ATP-dependent RNA helicase p62-like n=1 Tax=Elysia marginata TaxID=1093978 RepID=A0AAV4FRP9_9GAST|nr:ATP-dependent RNA helicase p62-like [Elysia marginata]
MEGPSRKVVTLDRSTLSDQLITRTWAFFLSYHAKQLPSGRELQRKDWVTLNRARAKVGKTARTLQKWKLRPNSECPCGNQNQPMDHILSECTEGPHCTDQDLRDCTDAAQAWITHWRDKI